MTQLTLAALKRSLEDEVKWSEDVDPAAVVRSDISPFQATQRQAKGWLGEEGMARIADRRGEIVLDAGRGIDDVNRGGPDLVTLAERENGEMYLKFYDNKTYKGEANVAKVPALESTFENNRELYLNDWQNRMERATPAQRDLLEKAADLLKERRYERVVTNWAGNSEGTTQRLQNDGIMFEDARLAEPPRRFESPFGPVAKPAVESATAPDGSTGFGPRLTSRR